jgi:sulfur relay (sulfurtransferase) DsrC/TusE family protein
MINCFAQCLNEFVEIFFVKENLMPVVTIIIKAFAAFGNSQKIIVAPRCPYIKKIGAAFTRSDSFAINAFHFLVVIFVRHGFEIFTVS